ncbi:hypothetical protein pb186bvf_020615 [Paramecium bursaria]
MDQDKKKRNRRCTKVDKNPRPYKCGCSKGYYSYPALYTHLKIKHDGVPPQGTEVPEFKHYGNRGRPKEKPKQDTQDIFIDEPDKIDT